MHAASVTITSTCCCRRLPPFISASVVRVCEVASRMRVATCATPLRGPRWKTATSGKGFSSVNRAMR
jgi:hypothetical protein